VNQLEFKAGESNIFFHILTACNLACSHCYIDPEQHGHHSVDRETITKWLRLFYDPTKTNNLIFLGGEPTLHKDLVYAIDQAHHMGYASITVDTNGFCFHNILDRISPARAFFSFSLDGPTPEINDPIRGEGSFKICLDNLKKAVTKGFDTSVIYTVSSRNINYLYKMPQLLAETGVKHFFIQVIGLRGNALTSANILQLTRDEWLQVIPATAQKASDLGISVVYPKVYLDTDEPFACAGNVAENYFIFPNGRVYRCPLCEDLPIHSLSIKKDRLLKRAGLTERQLFTLSIPEGCVMNKLLQSDNIKYDAQGIPKYRISCCLLKNSLDR
jgi:MoaA/NifB/PqqE/SkfB family radical SAM enzyme